MPTVSLDDAEAHLTVLILALNPGEQLVITRDGEPVATLTRTPPPRWPCEAGSAKATDHWMAPDFDAPIEEFRENME